MAFNTAATDLSTLSSSGLSLPEEQRVYIGLDGHDGTGSDVSYARQCIAQRAAQIRERVAQHAAGADIMLITCGLGGGTGSAAVELVRVLESWRCRSCACDTAERARAAWSRSTRCARSTSW
jgi:cell division GTPase FtsZ